MNRISAYFPLIIAALLAAATFWLEQVVRNEYQDRHSNLSHDPDLIANNIAVDRFDVEGNRITRITAQRLHHFPDNDSAELTAPIITMTRNARLTTFSSNTATAYNETKTVVMSGNVRGSRPAAGDAPGTTLATDELTVLTDDEIARTVQPVTLTHGAATLTGVGAEWNNLTGQFAVKSFTRTTFPPRKTHEAEP